MFFLLVELGHCLMKGHSETYSPNPCLATHLEFFQEKKLEKGRGAGKEDGMECMLWPNPDNRAISYCTIDKPPNRQAKVF